MNLSQIRDEARDAAADEIGEDTDQYWSNTEMNRIINKVYRRIAAETLCIKDSTTPAVCRIESKVVDYTTLTSGTQDYIWANDPSSWLYQKNVAPYLYEYHSSILRFDEVKWEGRPWKLTKVSAAKWQTNPWWEQVVGNPIEYCTDLESQKIAVNFRSQQDDVLRLVVRRLPLQPMSKNADTPEFKEFYHDFFLNGVLAVMFRKQDYEVYDKDKSDYHEALFLQELDEIKQKEIGTDLKLNPNYSMNAFR